MTATLTIRADCSPTIGTGHVMRMIALGQAWRALGGAVRFVGDTSPLNDRLSTEGFKTVPVPALHPDPSDLRTLLAETAPGDRIALDGYHFDTGYQHALRQAGRKVLVMDDVNDREEYDADILLNQNGDADCYDYTVNRDALRLLGTRYTLLRKEFLDARPNGRDIPDRAKTVLISLGGADPNNITTRILDALDRLDDNPGITVAAGAANPHLGELRKRISRMSAPCELLNNVVDMPSLMAGADLAVSGAGSTCWELCLLSVPMVAVLIAENQRGIAHLLESEGVAPVLDTSATVDDIAAVLKNVIADQKQRKSMAAAGKSLVDGKGAARVANALYGLGIRLRPVRAEDSRTLLDWRNAPSVRARSFSTEAIDPAEHDRWFKSKLTDSDCLFFVGEDDEGFPTGQLRFDREDGAATVSISVAPAMQGRGIGTTMTRLGCTAMAQTWPGVRALARVKPDNPASAAMFLKAGFSEIESPTNDYLQFQWTDDNDQ